MLELADSDEEGSGPEELELPEGPEVPVLDDELSVAELPDGKEDGPTSEELGEAEELKTPESVELEVEPNALELPVAKDDEPRSAELEEPEVPDGPDVATLDEAPGALELPASEEEGSTSDELEEFPEMDAEEDEDGGGPALVELPWPPPETAEEPDPSEALLEPPDGCPPLPSSSCPGVQAKPTRSPTSAMTMFCGWRMEPSCGSVQPGFRPPADDTRRCGRWRRRCGRMNLDRPGPA